MAETSFFDKSRSEQIGTIVKTGTRISSAYNVFKALMGGVVFIVLGVFFFMFVNPLIGLVIILVGLAIPVFTYRNRHKEMSLLNKPAESARIPVIADLSGENIVDYVAGVMAVGMGAATFVLGGGGQMKRPENAIVITNKNLWFVYVPMPGGADAYTENAGSTAATFDFLAASGDIENKLKELISQEGLKGVIATSSGNHSLALADLQSVETNIMKNVIFVSKSGEKFVYGLRKEEDRQKLLNLLKR